MGNELATMDSDRMSLLKRTICKGATDDEFALFTMVCNRTGLDPFARQVYAVKRWSKRDQREVMSIQTGIDGYRAVAEHTGCYAGSDDPVYDTEDGDHPNKASVTVWKIVGGTRVPFTASARWNEYCQTNKDGIPTDFWKRMPYLMLGKVAEALALRKAFPKELSGVYTKEEMDQADSEMREDRKAAYDPKKALMGKIAPKPSEPVAGEIVDSGDQREPYGDFDLFESELSQAFGKTGLKQDRIDEIKSAVLKAKGAKSLRDLSVEDRTAFVKAVIDNKFSAKAKEKQEAATNAA